MALAARVTQPRPAPVHGSPCSVGNLLATLEGDELDAFKTMLGTPERPGWTASDIYAAVTDEGHHVSYQQINRHRGSKCRCPKATA